MRIPESAPTASHSKRRASHFREGVNIATFDELADAEALKAILENNAIEAWVQDERRLQRFWFATQPQAGIHVRVPEPLLGRADECLKTKDAASVLRSAVRCPSCHSYRVEYPAMTRKNALPTLVAQVAVALRLAQHECYCESCQYTWVRVLPRSQKQ
jgi:hypothetical protein